jgi:hypothetical protein
LDTKELRSEASVLVESAAAAYASGEIEAFNRTIAEAEQKMAQADDMDAAATRLKALRGDLNRPLNNIPVTSNDVAIYNAMDTTASIKNDYKPASWIKGLPAMSQPEWVLDLCGDNVKDEARFMTDAFIKWFRSPSEDMFWKTASPDEIKAMQEDTDKLLCPVN